MDVLRKLRRERVVSASDVRALLGAFGVPEAALWRVPDRAVTLDALLGARVVYSAGDVRRLLDGLGLNGETVTRAGFRRGVEAVSGASVPVGGEAAFFGADAVLAVDDLVARIVRVLNR
uniref:MC139R n=1 Tax=Rousettus bat poxvirus TaxID=3141933 RepID=A0AAU7E269_9POXV